MGQKQKKFCQDVVQEFERVLRAQGHRLTKIRRSILDLFGEESPVGTCRLLSAGDIQKSLAGRKVPANKTTIYRELAFLQAEKIIREVPLRDGMRRYEFAGVAKIPDTHSGHHHLVCVNCHKVEEAILGKEAAAKAAAQAKVILKTKRFKVINQPQEFFGLCGDCQSL